MIILIRITPNASGYRLALFFARTSPVTTSSRKTARRNHRESLALSSCFISQSVGARQDTEMGSLLEHSAPLAGSIKMAKFQGVCFILDYIPRGQEPLSRWNVIFFFFVWLYRKCYTDHHGQCLSQQFTQVFRNIWCMRTKVIGKWNVNVEFQCVSILNSIVHGESIEQAISRGSLIAFRQRCVSKVSKQDHETGTLSLKIEGFRMGVVNPTDRSIWMF